MLLLSKWPPLTPWGLVDVAFSPLSSGKNPDSVLGPVCHYLTGEKSDTLFLPAGGGGPGFTDTVSEELIST